MFETTPAAVPAQARPNPAGAAPRTGQNGSLPTHAPPRPFPSLPAQRPARNGSRPAHNGAATLPAGAGAGVASAGSSPVPAGAGTASGEPTASGAGSLPTASIRTHVTVPLRFADGYATTGEVFTFDGLADGREHLAIGLGEWRQVLERGATGGPAPLVRPHSECLTGDVFGSQRCDCGPQLREAVEHITDAGGFLLYLRQEGRGIGLYAKLDAYALQDVGLDTYEANVVLGHGEDERDYTVAAQMLRALGATRVALLSNNPDKAIQLEGFGVRITERVPTGVHLSEANIRYLAAKVSHAAHTLDLPPAR